MRIAVRQRGNCTVFVAVKRISEHASGRRDQINRPMTASGTLLRAGLSLRRYICSTVSAPILIHLLTAASGTFLKQKLCSRPCDVVGSRILLVCPRVVAWISTIATGDAIIDVALCIRHSAGATEVRDKIVRDPARALRIIWWGMR